ncbi:hypothetical protein GIW50_04900 [Pseudomonas syringae]|uniref:Uncharacterized protein n=1 Tax=Pseudomonas syringae TaxID=317 RepID=A0A9Q3X1L7_PSESX|nr:hypothetical protein [Pseudomonas syringae]MCF5062225.1 hypothetical protein [Pseudomonas syringae]MCF5072334.1 hypothetical protein [Pseudomonas syringae]MCF5117747.1 hypothetical protein [Pseudomonas syringae]MCF5378793.1 hypothetical protein [Pseudomonas syringae]
MILPQPDACDDWPFGQVCVRVFPAQDARLLRNLASAIAKNNSPITVSASMPGTPR